MGTQCPCKLDGFLLGLVENLHSDSHGGKNGKNVWRLHTGHAILIVHALLKGKPGLLYCKQQHLHFEGLDTIAQYQPCQHGLSSWLTAIPVAEFLVWVLSILD